MPIFIILLSLFCAFTIASRAFIPAINFRMTIDWSAHRRYRRHHAVSFRSADNTISLLSPWVVTLGNAHSVISSRFRRNESRHRLLSASSYPLHAFSSARRTEPDSNAPCTSANTPPLREISFRLGLNSKQKEDARHQLTAAILIAKTEYYEISTMTPIFILISLISDIDDIHCIEDDIFFKEALLFLDISSLPSLIYQHYTTASCLIGLISWDSTPSVDKRALHTSSIRYTH